MPARTQELALAISSDKQSALQTAASSFWTLHSDSFNPAFPVHVNEDDADLYNKGDEFVTTIFPANLSSSLSWPFSLTSQNAAQVFCFFFGKNTKTGPASGAYQYVVTTMDPATDGVDLPAASIVSGLRAGTAGEMLDLQLIGMCCNTFELKISSGPNRSNATLNSSWIGCGKYVNNSGVAIPAITAEHLLQSPGASSLTINGINYLSGARFVEFTFSGNNNAIPVYYPGSGTMSSAGGIYNLAGKIRAGKRQFAFSHVAELESTSAELSALLAGTEGTATLTIPGPLITGSTYHSVSIVLQRLRFTGYSLGEADGFTTVVVDSTPMKHSSNGVVTITVITNKDAICQ